MTVEEIIDGLVRCDRDAADIARRRAALTDELRRAVSDKEGWDWITVKAAAELVDKSISFIYHRIQSGALTAKHLGSQKYVRRSEVKAIDDAYEPHGGDAA